MFIIFFAGGLFTLTKDGFGSMSNLEIVVSLLLLVFLLSMIVAKFITVCKKCNELNK